MVRSIRTVPSARPEAFAIQARTEHPEYRSEHRRASLSGRNNKRGYMYGDKLSLQEYDAWYVWHKGLA